MRDRFDYETYWSILDKLRETNRPVRLMDFADGSPEGRYFILRHDIDYSTSAALRLAQQEHDRGVAATYFLLPNCQYYNLLSPEHARVARRLIHLGHEVGLHYDVNFLSQFPAERWDELLAFQARIVESLSGAPVRSIAMHQPGLNGADPFRGRGTFINAYDDRFFRDIPYVSDSCRAWRDSAFDMFTRGPVPPRFQLVLHPINWSDSDRDRTTIFESIHRELAEEIYRAGDDLIREIRKHAGVLEHEARMLRVCDSAETERTA